MRALRHIGSVFLTRLRRLRLRVRARADSISAVRLNEGRNVLVLCYGNIYRSPFLEKSLKKGPEMSQWVVRSAGFHEIEDRLCEAEFVKAAMQKEIDLTGHRSRRVRIEDMEWSDLIIVPDSRVAELLSREGRQHYKKVVWASAFLNDMELEIKDPYGLPIQEQKKIIEHLDCAARKISKLLSA